MSTETLIRPKEAGKYLKSKWGFGTESTLGHLRRSGTGPKFYRRGARIVLYDPADLDAWAKAQLTEIKPAE